ncbi:MAG: hypothetical protein WBV06_11165 [Acidimicrobiia bacterium]
MLVISAIRQTEAWSGTSIVLGLLLLGVLVGLLARRIRRFMRDTRR